MLVELHKKSILHSSIQWDLTGHYIKMKEEQQGLQNAFNFILVKTHASTFIFTCLQSWVISIFSKVAIWKFIYPSLLDSSNQLVTFFSAWDSGRGKSGPYSKGFWKLYATNAGDDVWKVSAWITLFWNM